MRQTVTRTKLAAYIKYIGLIYNVSHITCMTSVKNNEIDPNEAFMSQS